MKVLVTNDDGADAPGLGCLVRAARAVFDEVMVVAPATQMSAISHAVTLHEPLRTEQREEGFYTVSGTPADCVLVALGHLCGEFDPDLVISGVNSGPNLGLDVYYSGTVAAAREALIEGVPAAAVSLVGPTYPFGAIEPVVHEVLVSLGARGVPDGCLLNVNIPVPRPDERPDVAFAGVPGIAGVRRTTLGMRDYDEEIIIRQDPRGRPYVWIGGAFPMMEPVNGTDCHAVARGYVSVTPIGLETTDFDAYEAMGSWNADPDNGG